VLSIDPSLESNDSRTFTRGLDDELAAHGHMLLVRQGHSTPITEGTFQDWFCGVWQALVWFYAPLARDRPSPE
jgi:hypothetical protein